MRDKSRASGGRWSGPALVLLLGASCGEGRPGAGAPAEAGGSRKPARSEEPYPWPAGTVLAVDSLAILPADVAPFAEAIAEVYPEYTALHLRRLALTNVILPGWAARARHPAERERALHKCEEVIDARDRGLPPPELHPISAPLTLEGRFGQLDLDLWVVARRLDVGVWSGPIELVGRWVLVRVEEREEFGAPEGTYFVLSVQRFPYVGTERDYYFDVEEALARTVDACTLTIVDPDWGEAVPETWRRRMSGG